MILLFLLLFLLNPLVGIVSYAMYCWKKETKSADLLILGLFMSSYLGLLNTTKEMAGDIAAYQDYFFSVPNFKNILTFLLSFGKEPLYYGYTYVSYYIFGGSWKLFVFSITVINYMLLSYGIVTTAKVIKADARNTITTLFFMFLFFQEFASSGHMIRQCLAQSIVIVFFVLWFIKGKKSWWIALAALATHTSSLPVLAVGLIPIIKKRLSLKQALWLVGCIILFAGLFYYLSPMLQNIPYFGYAVGRFNNLNLGADGWQEQIGLTGAMKVLLGVNVFLIGYIYKVIYKAKEDVDSTVQHIIPYVNIYAILTVFVIVCNMIGAYYLLMRYFFYLYALQNVLLLLTLHYSKARLKYIFQVQGVVLLFVYFGYYLSNGFFSYLPISDAILYPAPIYFMN
ncbi:hypothetical protein M2480_001570 [Parabacteroides sp. PFB2-12]|uniref:EpsG family protein n=1 Tax=unclassified Parabacteroides TaxID=2649774 RepID=UPI002475BEB4|nr:MULTISPECIES: EpsG family protein [unclassified Parabacteroides]MDH6342252.1 hypothetical protein [Parabacteroides sp. PM6-13]MDH6390595.1 hypothetical protein [Parabacteroides sp. PFB2-12]